MGRAPWVWQETESQDRLTVQVVDGVVKGMAIDRAPNNKVINVRRNALTALIPPIYFILLMIFMAWLLGDFSNLMEEKSEHFVLALYIGALTIPAALGYLVYQCNKEWHDYSRGNKIINVVIILAMTSIVWILYICHFFSFNLNY